MNDKLDPVRLDFEKDVTALTPAGNATERHLCQAYREKAEALFTRREALAEFWSAKLGIPAAEAVKLIDNPVKLEAKIRSATMKKGGVGYIAPTPQSFPPLEAFNSFILECGAIPTIAWLNGLSGGEADVDRLLDLHIDKGAAMLNIIPDRNCYPDNPARTARHLAELDRVVAACVERDLPVVIGTEMNAPGLKLVDDINCEGLRKHAETFIAGARILAGHTLFSKLSRGYLSDWAKRELPGRREPERLLCAPRRMPDAVPLRDGAGVARKRRKGEIHDRFHRTDRLIPVTRSLAGSCRLPAVSRVFSEAHCPDFVKSFFELFFMKRSRFRFELLTYRG